MDRETFFGGNPLSVLIRLVLISIVVGIVLSALDITPANLIYRLQLLVRHISDMGLDAFAWAGRYFLLGAVLVVPIWLIARFMGIMGGKDRGGPRH